MAVTTSRLRAARHGSVPAVGILAPSKRPIAVLVTAIIAVIVLTAVGFALKHHPVDLGLAQAFNHLHVGALGALTTLVYHLFSPAPAIIITAAVTALIDRKSVV